MRNVVKLIATFSNASVYPVNLPWSTSFIRKMFLLVNNMAILDQHQTSMNYLEQTWSKMFISATK